MRFLCYLSVLCAAVSALSIPVPANALARRQSYTGSSSGNDACHISAAAKYVRAVITHTLADAEAIPAEENVTRDEGPPGLLIETAANRQQLIASSVAGPQAIFSGPLYNNQQPVYSVTNSTSVRAVYATVVGLLNGTVPLTTTKIVEDFNFNSPSACLIQHIQAVFYPGQH